MMNRWIKITLIAFVALQGLIYGLQNLVNLDPAFQAVAGAVSMEGHAIYPAGIAPAITHPALIGVILGLIILGELLVGVFGLIGAWQMSRRWRGGADEFHAAKRFGLLACGLAIVIWFGLFMVIGGAGFQMWQTEAGGGALSGAFSYAVMSALVLLIVQQKEK